MELSLVLVVAVSLLAVSPTEAATGHLPKSYPLCKKSDPNLNTCLKNAVQAVVPQLVDGIPNLGVLSIDPLEVSSIDISQGTGPVAVALKFRNVKVYGLSKGIVRDSKADLKNFMLEFGGFAPYVRLEADYEMDGKILVLPVTGKGRCNITFDDMETRLGPKGKSTKKNGDSYFDVTDFKLDIFSLGKLSFNFENLFNGDKTLGESMNKIMNENWKDMWAELRPSFEKTFSAVFREYAHRLFSKVPMKDIFLD
ncbi:protein takeout [Anabrus simplex]|uniref:protein takeout n=1 Tax=Anabrus simplex TaxID=316456 RepID=UPI0035A2D8CE